MTMTVHVDIVSAESAIFSGLAEMVTAPALMGEVGIAPRHAPLLTPMRPGDVKLKLPNGEEEHYYVSGGILEVQPHLVTILSDTCIRAHDLDEAKALEAKKRAEEILEKQKSGKETAIAEHELADAAAQLRTIAKIRGRG